MTVWQLTVWFCRLFDFQRVNLFGYWLNFWLLDWLIVIQTIDCLSLRLFLVSSFNCWLFKFLSVWVSIVWFFFAIRFFVALQCFYYGQVELSTLWILNVESFFVLFCQSFCSTVKSLNFSIFTHFDCLTVWLCGT